LEHQFDNMRVVVILVSIVLSVFHKFFSLIPNIFTSVGG